MHYLFGDTDLAAKRLRILAEIYKESTRPFLIECGIEKPRLAVDMGCGPGYTTHFLADVLKCDQTVGLDNSEQFILLAQKSKTERISFYPHDVTSVPFPVEPGDFLYCRFLLTHLQNPDVVVANWAAQLRPGGLLLMEETEWITTKNAVFALYINIVEALLEHQSTNLYVGPLLNALKFSKTLKRRNSGVRRLQVATHRAATMFFLNIQSWKHQPFIRENYSFSVINKLEEDLRALTEKIRNEVEIEWGLRQLVFERI